MAPEEVMRPIGNCLRQWMFWPAIALAAFFFLYGAFGPVRLLTLVAVPPFAVAAWITFFTRSVRR